MHIDDYRYYTNEDILYLNIERYDLYEFFNSNKITWYSPQAVALIYLLAEGRCNIKLTSKHTSDVFTQIEILYSGGNDIQPILNSYHCTEHDNSELFNLYSQLYSELYQKINAR